MVNHMKRKEVFASPRSAAAWAKTIVKLEVSKTKVLKAPAGVLVIEASSNPGALLNLKSRKHIIKPPKIKISDANNHQTANLPVGMPEAVRCVAIGPCVDMFISN